MVEYPNWQRRSVTKSMDRFKKEMSNFVIDQPEARLQDITDALRHLRQPCSDHQAFPWKENIRMRFGYPGFMMKQLQNRNAVSDKSRLQKMIANLRAKTLAKWVEDEVLSSFPVGSVWSRSHLEVQGNQMCIEDYPFTNKQRYVSAPRISSLLEKGVSTSQFKTDCW